MKTKLEKWTAKLEKLKEEVDELIEQRENYYDSRSDKWLESDKSETYYEITTWIEDARDSIEEAFDQLTDIYHDLNS